MLATLNARRYRPSASRYIAKMVENLMVAEREEGAEKRAYTSPSSAACISAVVSTCPMLRQRRKGVGGGTGSESRPGSE